MVFENQKRYLCNQCAFEYFQNVASAVGVFIEYGGKYLFVVRNQQPKKGLLDIPGGFTDVGETAEAALRREVLEEIAFELPPLTYLGTFANQYEYKDVLYHTCDVFFHCTLDHVPGARLDKEEVKSLEWHALQELDPGRIAFDSAKKQLLKLQEAVT